MVSSSDDTPRTQTRFAQKSPRRTWVGNTFRGLLLAIDVLTGAVLTLVGLRYLAVPLDEGGPLSIELPTAILCWLSVALGIWLVCSGAVLVLSKRPNCWRTGVWTHLLVALGIFLFIPAMSYQAQYELLVRPGHMAMEGALATGVLSIAVGIFGVLWVVAAIVLYVFHRSDRKHSRIEVEPLLTQGDDHA